MAQTYHIAALDVSQANNLPINFITASLPNISGLKAVALEDANFNDWVGSSIIVERADPPQTNIQKLFDLSGYGTPPFVAIMPVASSSLGGNKFTTCNLYQFETEVEFLNTGWKVPKVDGDPIAPAGTSWPTINDGADAISSNGGLLYYYNQITSNNTILS